LATLVKAVAVAEAPTEEDPDATKKAIVEVAATATVARSIERQVEGTARWRRPIAPPPDWRGLRSLSK